MCVAPTLNCVYKELIIYLVVENIKNINIIRAVPNKKNNLFAIAKKIRNTAIILTSVFNKFDFIRFKF